MTDEEITRIIAEKVMGYAPAEGEDGLYWVGTKGARTPDWFTPLLDGYDCMAAWDKFSETTFTQLIRNADEDDGWEWYALCAGVTGCSKDRRRAICECMAKALT